MSLPIAALGAVLAAILQTSVLPELGPPGVQPNLVLVFAIVSGMVLGFEEGLVWAFLGGLMLDMLLPDRPIGSTTLALLIVTGLALLIARVTDPPRIIVIVITVFALSFLYEALFLVILAVTANVALVSVPFQSLAIIATLNAVLAAIVARGMRSLLLRFGPAERIDW
jgi:rod shape-determining protein MreD